VSGEASAASGGFHENFTPADLPLTRRRQLSLRRRANCRRLRTAKETMFARRAQGENRAPRRRSKLLAAPARPPKSLARDAPEKYLASDL
jgi:hypothetical protein